MLTYILIVVLLYVLLFILNMSHFERTILYKFFTHGGLKNIRSVSEFDNEGVSYGTTVKDVLLSPFCMDRHKISKLTGGTILNFYSYHDEYFNKRREMGSKLFWNDCFSKNGIKTPKVFGTTKPLTLYEPINPDEMYISKPVNGIQGVGVKLVKGEDIKVTEDNRLIQERIKTCNHEGARSFRAVTTYDGTLLSVEELKSDAIISNHAGGGTTKMCDDDMCGEYEKLHKPIKQLRDLHKRDFGFCFCIGWDLVVDCEEAYVLEGNWPNGLFDKNDDIADEFYDTVKPMAKEFYKRQGI